MKDKFRSLWLDNNTGTQFEEYSVQTTEEDRYLELERLFDEYSEEIEEEIEWTN